ncbi:MAG: hypothetical protein ACJ790_16060 [Myxococcaceae bacterium]
MKRLLLTALLLSGTAFAQQKVSTANGTPVVAYPFPAGQTQSLNIINWDSNQLPKIYERSDQLPLTDPEITKLSQAGFEPSQLVKMIEERRCACDASADGLIKLKQAGVNKDVLSAISLHSLAPNRQLNLMLTLDFSGESRTARQAYFYVFVDDGPITRVMSLNLDELLRRQNSRDTVVDKSDLLIQHQVRRIQFPGVIPLTTYGKHNVMVVASGSPTLTHPDQLKESERKYAQLYTFDYPRSSIQSNCRLTAGYLRDPVLPYQWNYQGSRFECEWN